MADPRLAATKASFKQQLQTIKKQLMKAITVDFISNFQMLKLGNEAIRIIHTRTREGLGVRKSGGRTHQLKALKKSTIAARRRYRGLSGETSPEKSNLTFTGQMLDSLKVKIVSRGRSYIAPSGARKGGGPNNARVGEFVSVERPFNDLSSNEIKDLEDFYLSTFQDVARKNLLNYKK